MPRTPQAHVFGWDEEPADERPSEFMPVNSGYSVLSGYHVPRDMSRRAAQRRRGSGLGLAGVAVAFVVFLGASAVAIHQFAKLLHF